MNRRAIWAIVGLMSTALIGIIILQSYWIRNAFDLKREQFDSEVNIAINQVVQKLRDYEIEEKRRLDANGLLTVSEKVNQDYKKIFNTDVLDISGLDPLQEDKSNVHSRIYQKYRSAQAWIPKSLENRIKLDVLENLLGQELKSRGIDTDYDYQVYATFKGIERRLIISNGHYVAAPEATDEVTVLTEPIKVNKLEHKVALFEDDINSPGELVVSFPRKASVILEAVLMPLIAAIVFTGIVLFCFTYTIRVIFNQKKLAEMKTDFVNNMTHEFKTPIATISLAVDSITSPMILNKQEKIKRFAGIIKQENRRMLSQVEKVLQMALLDKKDLKLNLDFVDLHKIIEQAVTTSRLQAENKGGFVKVNLKATKTRIEGDVTHILNIIHNLLDNANKYSPEIPEITVLTRDVPNGVEVTVQDKGIGLSKEARKNIFDKFYRVHTGNVHDVKGFGLGLAYVKTMMTAHKGHIDVKSELGKGSSFILTFPFHIREVIGMR